MTTMNNEDLSGCPHPQIIAYAIAADAIAQGREHSERPAGAEG